MSDRIIGVDGVYATADEPLRICMQSNVLLRDGASFFTTPLSCTETL